MSKRDYQICKICVMDTSDINIKFDEDGMCDHCHNFYTNLQDNWLKSINLERESELKKLAIEIKESGKGKKYDCIIGISGGTDSSFMLHYLVTELELRPLVFHVDGGWNTKSAVSNIYNLVTIFKYLYIYLFTSMFQFIIIYIIKTSKEGLYV